jgi:protein-S-isoprenylcysteine O-methyltransferase Ste14
MHWPLNGLIAVLWGRFVLAALNQCLIESHPLTFGIMIHNTLLMFFFLMRRKSLMVSSKALDWVIPFLTLCGALMLRPAEADPQFRATASAWLQCFGLTGIIFSLLSLGKSFGIVPANRKIVCAGAYRVVRHPLYFSEIVFYTGFVSADPSLKNVVLILMILAGQLYRSVSEESLLAFDPSYRSYREKVRYRFIPGLF